MKDQPPSNVEFSHLSCILKYYGLGHSPELNEYIVFETEVGKCVLEWIGLYCSNE